MLRGLLLILFVLVLSGARAFAQGGSVVGGVEFAGRVNVQESACLDAIALKPGAQFTREKLEADRRALLATGFFRSVTASQKTSGADTRVTFRLVEWPVVRHIRVLGNTVVEARAIREVISTQLGQVLCAPLLQDDVRAIERLYRERGYVARISEKLLDDAAQNGILKFEILELRIAEVQLKGGTPALRKRAESALLERAPNLYRPEAVTLDQRRLLRVRGIKHAIPTVSIVAPGQVKIVWRINPPPETPQPEMPQPDGPRVDG